MVPAAHSQSRHGMKQVDFFELTRGVQDRLLRSCRGDFDPKPILFRHSVHSRGTLWLGLVPLALIGGYFFYATGLGDMTSAMGRQPLPTMAVYILAAVAFAVGLVQWAANQAATRALPFVPGFYLFPACLVDARSTTLFVTPMTELSAVSIDGDDVVVKVGGTTHRFPVPQAHREQAVSAIKLAQMQVGDGLEDAARVLLDPFAPPVVADPFAPEKALVERKPLWVKIRLLAAAAVGVVGVVLFQHRDRVSDDMMFKAAKAKDDVASYQLYLQKGTAHKTEVSRLLLPRTELRTAIAEGSVAAIDAFKVKYPDTDIGDEVEAARKRAIEVAFLAAKKVGTFEALSAFDASFPGHHVEQHVAGARHEIYAQALKAFVAKLPKTAKMAEVAPQLVAYAEKKGPVQTPEGVRGAFMEVRMRAVPSKALKKADGLVERNPYFSGPKSLPSRYLHPDKLAAVEDEVAKRYAEAIGKGFPESVLRVRVGEDADGSADLPTVDKPTLVVSYRLEPSGVNYASAKPRGIFIGVVFFFRVDLLLPGGGESRVMKHVLNVKVPGKLVIAHAKKPEGRLETKIYDKMTAVAFDDLYRRYIDQWLGSKALD